MVISTIHCFACYRFPSREVEFFLSNCMHIFCALCKSKCEFRESNLIMTKCAMCSKTPIKFLPMNSQMPTEIKKYFAPIGNEVKSSRERIIAIITFQKTHQQNLISHLKKKEEYFNMLKEKYIEERNKKQQYKKALENCQLKLKEKSAELEEMKSISNFSETSSSRFSNSIISRSNNTEDPYYKTPKPPLFHKSISSTGEISKKPFQSRISATIAAPRCRTMLYDKGYCTPVQPAKHPNQNPMVYKTPVQPATHRQVLDNQKNSANSNSSASFIDT